MVLCFRLVTNSMLIIHECFSYCWTVLYTLSCPFLSHSVPNTARRLGVDKWLGGDSSPQLTKEIPYNIMLSHKATGVVGELFQGSCLLGVSWCWLIALASLGFYCHPSWFVFSVHLLNSLYFDLQAFFLISALLILSSILMRGEEANAWVRAGCGQHTTVIY